MKFTIWMRYRQQYKINVELKKNQMWTSRMSTQEQSKKERENNEMRLI